MDHIGITNYTARVQDTTLSGGNLYATRAHSSNSTEYIFFVVSERDIALKFLGKNLYDAFCTLIANLDSP